MVNRFTGLDIRNKIVTLLTDVSTGFNVMVGTINTERTHVAPTALKIETTWGQNQYPFLLVEMQNSTVLFDDAAAPMTMQYKHMPETYNLTVAGFLKAFDDRVTDWVEDWIEAVIRVVHGYNSSDISWILCTGTERTDIYTEEHGDMKVFSVNFEIRIN